MKNSARADAIVVSADGLGLVSQAGTVLLWQTMRVTGLARGSRKARPEQPTGRDEVSSITKAACPQAHRVDARASSKSS